MPLCLLDATVQRHGTIMVSQHDDSHDHDDQYCGADNNSESRAVDVFTGISPSLKKCQWQPNSIEFVASPRWAHQFHDSEECSEDDLEFWQPVRVNPSANLEFQVHHSAAHEGDGDDEDDEASHCQWQENYICGPNLEHTTISLPTDILRSLMLEEHSQKEVFGMPPLKRCETATRDMLRDMNKANSRRWRSLRMPRLHGQPEDSTSDSVQPEFDKKQATGKARLMKLPVKLIHSAIKSTALLAARKKQVAT